MNAISIQGNEYDLQFIESMTEYERECTLEEFNDLKQFQKDIYTTYVQIRTIIKPKSCEKVNLDTVKKSVESKAHWLELYLNLTLQEANIVIDYAEKFYGLAIK